MRPPTINSLVWACEGCGDLFSWPLPAKCGACGLLVQPGMAKERMTEATRRRVQDAYRVRMASHLAQSARTFKTGSGCIPGADGAPPAQSDRTLQEKLGDLYEY